MKGAREGRREGGRKGRREGSREGEREGRNEGRREGGRGKRTREGALLRHTVWAVNLESCILPGDKVDLKRM